MKGSMGVSQRPYYLVLMRAKDLVSKVKTIDEILLNKEISIDLQREIKQTRTKEIMEFFQRDDRFISSIVAASLGGNPEFVPLQVKSRDPLLTMGGFGEIIGALTFQGGHDFYAIDGQHRLSALRDSIDGKNPPNGIEEDQIPVVLLTNPTESLDVATRRRYRRVFTWMNRYAKPTTKEVNIIMDEDDLFAIVTRELLLKHPQFNNMLTKETGKDSAEKMLKWLRKIASKGALRVNIRSNSIKTNSTYFTTLRTLYKFTEKCLEHSGIVIPEDATKLIVEDEDLANRCYEFSSKMWDSLGQMIEDIGKSPDQMRADSKPGINHMFFRPIGQLVIAEAIATMLDDENFDDRTSVEEWNELLSPLSCIDWELSHRPWINILMKTRVDDNGTTEYRMRDEERKKGIDVAVNLLLTMLCKERVDWKSWSDALISLEVNKATERKKVQDVIDRTIKRIGK